LGNSDQLKNMSSHERKEWFSWKNKKLTELDALCKDPDVTRYEIERFIEQTYNELYDKDVEIMKHEDTSYIDFHNSILRKFLPKKQYIDGFDNENVKFYLQPKHDAFIKHLYPESVKLPEITLPRWKRICVNGYGKMTALKTPEDFMDFINNFIIQLQEEKTVNFLKAKKINIFEEENIKKMQDLLINKEHEDLSRVFTLKLKHYHDFYLDDEREEKYVHPDEAEKDSFDEDLIYSEDEEPIKRYWFPQWSWFQKKQVDVDVTSLHDAAQTLKEKFYHLFSNMDHKMKTSHIIDQETLAVSHKKLKEYIKELEMDLYVNSEALRTRKGKTIFQQLCQKKILEYAKKIQKLFHEQPYDYYYIADAEVERLETILDEYNPTPKPRTWRSYFWGSGRSHRRDRRRKRRHGKTYKRHRHCKTRRQRY